MVVCKFLEFCRERWLIFELKAPKKQTPPFMFSLMISDGDWLDANSLGFRNDFSIGWLGASLPSPPDIYNQHRISRGRSIISDPSHPSHSLFSLSCSRRGAVTPDYTTAEKILPHSNQTAKPEHLSSDVLPQNVVCLSICFTKCSIFAWGMWNVLLFLCYTWKWQIKEIWNLSFIGLSARLAKIWNSLQQAIYLNICLCFG